MWFDVDKEGLAKLMERRGRKFILDELIGNAWDQNVSVVSVSLVKIPNRRELYELSVIDDDPEGFKDIKHAFTLFAESSKKGDAEARGRFNLGEKLVLAVCEAAEISTVSGTVIFDDKGRSVRRVARDIGSHFKGQVRMTKEQYDECCEHVLRLIPPANILTTFNGVDLAQRKAKAIFQAELQTELADENGNMRKRTRETTVSIYEPLPGETPYLYEMGIPVVETDDRWHVNVAQKIPLNMDRDNVPPTYLRNIRTLVLNNTYKDIPAEALGETWVREACKSVDIAPEAFEHIVTTKHGHQRVTYDPGDMDANRNAAIAGANVVSGGNYSTEEWGNIKRFGLMQPAGQVYGSGTRYMPPVPISYDRAVSLLKDICQADDKQIEALVDMARRELGIREKVR